MLRPNQVQFTTIPVPGKANVVTVIFDGLPILDGDTGMAAEYDLNPIYQEDGKTLIESMDSRIFAFRKSMQFLAQMQGN